MSESSAAAPSGPAPPARFLSLPASKLGRWSMWLEVAFVVLFALNVAVITPLVDDPSQVSETFRMIALPVASIAMLLTGFSAGVLGFISIMRSGERSWVVWLTLVPTVLITFFLAGEFLVPH